MTESEINSLRDKLIECLTPHLIYHGAYGPEDDAPEVVEALEHFIEAKIKHILNEPSQSNLT